MKALLLALSACAVASLQLPPPPLLRVAAPATARAVIVACDPAAAADDDGGNDDEDMTTAGRLVDPMTTSLGREDELSPYPGPPIEIVSSGDDDRPLFVSVSQFAASTMPSEALQDAYHSYIADGGDAVCAAHFMLAKDDFADEADTTGVSLTDTDIAALDAQEEEQAAAGAENGEEEAAGGEGAQAGEGEGAGSSGSGGGVPATWQMIVTPVQFISAHLTITRHAEGGEAEAWRAADPIGRAGGYASVDAHQWLRLDEPELSIKPTGELQQTFAVHCLDKPGGAGLRASTRDAHLGFLRESGRVCMAGPLLAPPAGAGDRVGSLLVVHGDTLEDVAAWAASDPYALAGLFERVRVAPLGTYHVGAAPTGEVERSSADPALERA